MSDNTGLSEGFYDALGRTIKVARADLGIERAELAERAGISYSYLAAIENGQKQPSSQVLLALAEALGLRSHELLESTEIRRERNLSASDKYPAWLSGKPAPMPARMVAPAQMVERPAPPSGDFVKEMGRLARDLSEEDRAVLLALARRLVGGRQR
jgi:transcriptional regulator with XRE-family HTH domain